MGRRIKVVDLLVDTYGNYLGMKKGCIILKDKNKKEKKYPLFEAEIGEVVLTSGNLVSTGALTALGFWGIDVLIATKAGRPIAMLKNLDDNSHIKTRISQYESLKNGKAIDIAKAIVTAKLLSQNQVLKKWGLRQHDLMRFKGAIQEADKPEASLLRRKLVNIEGRFSRLYFKQVFQLIPPDLRPDARKGYQAYDAINNIFNLAYELLFWKCYRALSKAHLETHLGFVHILLHGRPSLVCDFEELYRYLIDDFLIGYVQKLTLKDFTAKTEMFNGKRGKRIYLNKTKNKELFKILYDYFRSIVRVPRMNRGKSQEVESLINEEALLLAKYLRGEKAHWNPRIVEIR
jgi:CRISPR-associated protein Cas1